MECNQCHRIFTRSDNLHRHMKIHNRQVPNSSIRNQPYPESTFPKGPEESRTLQDQQEEDRLERLEVLNGEIDDIINQSVEKMKEKIWVIMAESHEFEERERKGGSLALTGQKKDEDELIEKEDEDASNEKEEEEEEIFIDVIRKDAAELGEMNNELSHSKNDKATEIKALMNSYFNDKHKRVFHWGTKRAFYGRTKAIDDVIEILKSLRESETIALASRMYALVQKIENTRQLINRLFSIMDEKNEEEKDNTF